MPNVQHSLRQAESDFALIGATLDNACLFFAESTMLFEHAKALGV